MCLEPQKRKTETDSPGKERTKAKRTEKREQEMNRIYLEALQNDESEKTPPQPASSSTGGSSTDVPKGKPPKASSTGGSSTALPKKTIMKASTIIKQTTSQLSPSVIGIQRLREAFLEAKNKNILSPKDISSYMKLYDDWKGAVGNKQVKKDKIDELRVLYKKVLYKK